MYDVDTFDCNDPIEEGKHTPKERLTPLQKDALAQIDTLNLSYPKRWFTPCELDRVIPVTLDALVKKGYLLTKESTANPKVQYWQRTGKQIKT